MSKLPYDNTDAKSIELYAKKLIGHTFSDVIRASIFEDEASGKGPSEYRNKNQKGRFGNLLEECFFGYKPNSDSDPDFPEAGVELKVSPYERIKNGEYRAGERLVLSMINYSGPIENTLEASHLWHKCKLLLLVYYFRNRNLRDQLLYPIHFVSLFTPSETDLIIIRSDYKTIAAKIQEGKAEELSESDTFYLGACTKGQTAKDSFAKQFYPPHTPAKRRAFCYKNSYMSFVLKNYLMKNANQYESLIKDISELSNQSFSDFITSKINSYKGKTDKVLCELFDREYNNNKAQWADLAYRMLGIKSNRAEEFRKANIIVKVIRLEENGKMRENMSFPPFRYSELINESWEESTLYKYFNETRFLFVVFRRVHDCYELKGCQLWNMPYHDLNSTVKNGWEAVVKTIREGVRFSIKQTKRCLVVGNNLPKQKDNAIIHVRPHARKSYFEFPDGTIIGEGSRSDANQLPNGTWMTNYSFWINNNYIVSQLDDCLSQN